ncbi:MAG TPA: type II secretion system protein [Terracidiphilus sp.]|nr:type II secretion system protein [Terracidiphilus sp.]
MTRPNPTRLPHSSEEGYILIWVIFMLAILTISLSVAAPRVAKEIQLDRERETMERGKQYTRAVQLYYRKFNAYPPNIDALVKTSEIRFLRKKYTDPMTGKDDWKPIRFGQAKTQTLGFFGQPIPGAGSAGGSVMAGTGPSGGNGINGASTIGGPGSSIGSSSLFGSSNSGAGPGSTTPTAGSPTGSSAGSTGSTSSTGPSGSDTGLSGQTFGGAGIIGFSPASPRESILIFKKKNHYNEWEFVYDPLTDMRTVSGNTGAIGQPASSTSTPIGGSGFGAGTAIGPGSGSGTGSNPAPPPTPAPPQQ